MSTAITVNHISNHISQPYQSAMTASHDRRFTSILWFSSSCFFLISSKRLSSARFAILISNFDLKSFGGRTAYFPSSFFFISSLFCWKQRHWVIDSAVDVATTTTSNHITYKPWLDIHRRYCWGRVLFSWDLGMKWQLREKHTGLTAGHWFIILASSLGVSLLLYP